MLKIYLEASNRLHALKAYMRHSKGTTATEYSLVAAGIAVASLVVVLAIEPHLVTDFG